MNSGINSLIKAGTKLWLDSVDPDLVKSNFAWGTTGATSNPIIISDLIKTGRFDEFIREASQGGKTPDHIAWLVTDRLVSDAEKVFKPVFDKSKGDDGYVSFELDPLLEDAACSLPLPARIESYIELGRLWSKNHPNRMIKVPATPAGMASLEELAASGVPLNVTLIFTERQYKMARDAVWKGAQRRRNLETFKSVYSIFVSRIDVYTASKYPQLSAEAQGLAGIVNAQKLWTQNKDFWSKHKTPLAQEIIFASTGTKNPQDKPWKYVEALAGSDIQTNPPQTNQIIATQDIVFEKRVSKPQNEKILLELEKTIDWARLEDDLMTEGLSKFSEPQKALLELVAKKSKAFS